MKTTVYFLDIDDCLIETSRLGKAELSALNSELEKMDIPHFRKITKEFADSFHRLYDKHQGKQLSSSNSKELEKYLERLKELQSEIITKWGQIKKWSREACLYIAAEKFAVRLTSKQTDQATRTLWKSITAHTPFYPDSRKFLLRLQAKKIPFYLITSSDCRLKFNDRKGLFEYDPDYSRELKLERLFKFLNLGIPKENIFLGDPHDKPNLWVFRQALAKAKKVNSSSFISVMIGDSPENDLFPSRKAGMDELVWLDRQTKTTPKSDLKMKIISSFDEVKIWQLAEIYT